MSATATLTTDGSQEHDAHEEHNQSFVTKYIFSLDHKIIGKQYLITGIIMAVIGIFMSVLFRIQLAWPDQSQAIFSIFLGEKWAPDGVMSPDAYLGLVTMHGTIMVFFVLTAGLSGTFSNYLIPLQIGARDMASGFINMLSSWIFITACLIMLSSLFVQGGPAMGGWTVYPPLSALPEALSGSGTGIVLWIVAMAFFIAQSLLGAINYIVTILNFRTKGMTMTRLPLTVWSFLITAIVAILSFPVLLAAVLLLLMDHSFGTSFYLSDIYIQGEVLSHQGGSPILFEHLFWFLGHPEVYLVVLPAMGIVSEVLATHARKPIFGYRAMIASLLAIAFLSTIVWGHHMFVSGMNPFLGSVFTFTTLLIAIPSAVKAFNWTTTIWKGNLQLNPPMLWSIGMISTFVSGGLTGLVVGDSTLDIQVHDTYFVIAHFHLVMGISAAFGFFAGIYQWFPKMFGKMMNKTMGYIHFWVTIIGVYGVFFPMHFVGLAGLPRRYYNNTAFPYFDDLLNVNVLISVCAIMAAVVQLVFLYNFFHSMIYGPKAPLNPWNSTTLEWTTPIERIHGNWPGEIPHVYRWAYDYSKLNADGTDYVIPGQDYIPQNVPTQENEPDHGY